MNNLHYNITKLHQWITSRPRTAASYLSLLTSVVIASCVLFVSIPKNAKEISLQARLVQLQPATAKYLQPASNLKASIATTASGTTKTLASIQALIPSTTLTLIPKHATAPVITTRCADNTNTIAKIVTVRNKDSLGKIFKRLNLDQKNVKTILALNDAKVLKNLKSGQKLNFSLTADQKLQQITQQIDPTNTLIITANNNNKFKAKINHIEPTVHMSFITATVHGSVYGAAKKAGISGKMLAQIKSIFNEKIDLSKLRNGDKITVLRKDYYINDQKINNGDIAVVELINKGKSYNAVAYTDPTGRTDFYTPEGYTLKSAFVRYPFKFRCISSPFSLRRYQPLLHIYREHTGVDLAGTPGTPVKATSDGVIAFAGEENGYGNIVVVQHNQYSTAYAHLQGFAKQIRHGSTVKQGQVIGYLGETGLTTGPHVHFEFRINGTPVDPAKVKLPVGEMIAKAYRSKFFSQSKTMLAQLNTQKHLYAAISFRRLSVI